MEAGRYAGCVKGDLWNPPVNGESRIPYGPSASASVELICSAERKEEGSTLLKGGGVEQWRLLKMALDTHLLNVQLSMVSHLCKYKPLGNEFATSRLCAEAAKESRNRVREGPRPSYRVWY